MAEDFYIEPWQVEETLGTLTLRDTTTVRDSVMGGSIAWSLSLLVAAVDYWLWQRGTIEGFAAAWLGFVSALLAAKGIEQVGIAWRLRTHGSRCLTFHRDDCSVKLNGFQGRTNVRLEQIVVEVRALPQENQSGRVDVARTEYTTLLVVDGQRLELATFGAEAAASRLVETISNFVGIRHSRSGQEPDHRSMTSVDAASQKWREASPPR